MKKKAYKALLLCALTVWMVRSTPQVLADPPGHWGTFVGTTSGSGTDAFYQVGDTLLWYRDGVPVDTFYLGSSGSQRWTSYEEGVAPASNLPVYITSEVVCKPDTAQYWSDTAHNYIETATLAGFFGAAPPSLFSSSDVTGVDSISAAAGRFRKVVGAGPPLSGHFVFELPDSLCSIGESHLFEVTGLAAQFQGLQVDTISYSNGAVGAYIYITPVGTDYDSTHLIFNGASNLHVFPLEAGPSPSLTLPLKVDAGNITLVDTNEVTLQIPITDLAGIGVGFVLFDSTHMNFSQLYLQPTITTSKQTGNVLAGIDTESGRLASREWKITTTYSNFVSLLQSGQLAYPAEYVISDYKCSHLLKYTDLAGDGTGGGEWSRTSSFTEPLVVQTTGPSTYNEKTVRSTIFPQDQIWWTHDVEDYASDIPSGATGVIYKRITASLIEYPLDIRSWRVIRWADADGDYTISQRSAASDTSDWKVLPVMSPFNEKVLVDRNGSPDQSNYKQSNNYGRHFMLVLALPTVTGSDTVFYDSAAIYPAYNVVLDHFDTDSTLVTSSAFPAGTEVVEISPTWFRVSNVATSTGTAAMSIYHTVAGKDNVNESSSSTNNSLLSLSYDNQLYVMLGNVVKGILGFNQALSFSGNSILSDFTFNHMGTFNNTTTSGYVARSTFGYMGQVYINGDLDGAMVTGLQNDTLEVYGSMSEFGSFPLVITNNIYGQEHTAQVDKITLSFGGDGHLVPMATDSVTIWEEASPKDNEVRICTDCYDGNGKPGGGWVFYNGSAWKKLTVPLLLILPGFRRRKSPIC